MNLVQLKSSGSAGHPLATGTGRGAAIYLLISAPHPRPQIQQHIHSLYCSIKLTGRRTIQIFSWYRNPPHTCDLAVRRLRIKRRKGRAQGEAARGQAYLLFFEEL